MTLEEFFTLHPKVALGFSGGTDSAYLLYEAVKHHADVAAFYMHSQFQPAFELEDARRFAKELGISIRIIPLDVLSDEKVIQNDAKRCYYCKQRIFSTLLAAAKAEGYDTILDGTNASDDVNDRPGYAALQEMKVLSPLRECGLTKEQIRENSKAAGLFTADKPSYACLATRVWEHPLTAESLQRAEEAENALMALGYRDFRVRCKGSTAKVQIARPQYLRARTEFVVIKAALEPYFTEIILDEPRIEEAYLWK